MNKNSGNILSAQEFSFDSLASIQAEGPAGNQTQTESAVQRIVLYTDGGCQGNPGPGAWAAVCYLEFRNGQSGRNICEIAGSAAQTTNNQMELQAVIEGLKALPQHYPQLFAAAKRPEVAIYTDSQYVKNGITSWIHSWKRNSWKTSGKKPVKNQEFWRELDRQVTLLGQQAQLQWHWVKGHAGHFYNERCDELVRQNFPG